MVEIEEVVPTIRVNKGLNSKLLEELMRKFEINKKLYVGYDDEFKKPVTSEEISKEIYSQLIICFCLQAYTQNDVRFYNTALKISDLIDIELPQIKF